ncbi:MAG TPA: DUF4185 domain-containing protein [Mucilaginibacter sp.]|jgi:hypothetical protein|nr:DUF4185 domain-containing protein [Mucilaginibacter sp.]
MKKTIFPFGAIMLILIAGRQLQAQSKVNLNDVAFTVEEAPKWSALLKRNSGWFGADGIYTIPLNGREHEQAGKLQKTLFIFSDTMIGEVTDSAMAPGYKMIHNSVACLVGNKPDQNQIQFYWDKGADGKPESIFIPHTPKTQAGDYFWLGDGFYNQATHATYIFGYRVHNVSEGAFGFKEVGNTIIKLPANSRPPFSDQQQMDTPFYLDDSNGIGSYGAGIFVNTAESGAQHPDGYVYVYGVIGLAKKLVVARVLPIDFEHFDQWKFWDGKDWVNDMDKAAPVTDKVSNELSLTALADGRYALVFQEGGMSTTIGMRIGASPTGPFGPIIKLWDCSKSLEEKTYVVYNAKAHPSLSAPGELLITYNVNSVEFIKDLNKHPHLYRPRFIRVKFK